MRDPQQFPKYLLVGLGNEGTVTWRIQRASDMALCALDPSFTADDGAYVGREPEVREWRNGDQASAYIARLEDGTAGSADIGDEPVVWVPPLPPHQAFARPPEMHAD